jgi:hypothetical protein
MASRNGLPEERIRILYATGNPGLIDEEAVYAPWE